MQCYILGGRWLWGNWFEVVQDYLYDSLFIGVLCENCPSNVSMCFSLAADAPPPPEKLMAGVLGVVCLILVFTVARVILLLPCK